MRLFLLTLCLVAHLPTLAQIGGRQTFSFLTLPANARVAALGAVNLTADHRDPSLFLANPALSSDSAHAHVSLQLFTLRPGATQTVLTGLLRRGRHGRLGLGLQYLGYGPLDGYDATGAPTGTFAAADYALTLNYAHTIAPFTLGANLKLAGSVLGQYSATAVLVDVGGAFVHPTRDLRFGLAIKNLGVALSNYAPNSDLALPFDVQLGASFKPAQMPIRFSFTAHQLFPPGEIVYNDPSQNFVFDNNGNRTVPDVTLADRLSRRLVLGAELIAHRNVNFRLGYNFLQRRELSLPDRRALVGFSVGFMVRIKGVEVAYAYNVRHLAGGLSCLALSLDTQKLAKRRKTTR
jgi:hypothetical protein